MTVEWDNQDTYLRIAWRWLVRLFKRADSSRGFRTCYAIASLVILLATTLLWTILGARLQSHNADQLSDPYLFSNLATFRGASFPGTHTFLLKWPIFWLLGVFGVTPMHLLIATAGVVLATVGVLIFVAYRVNRNPIIFGTLCLGVSLALLLVPAQPYAGALLPVGMSMLTTRNVEYAVYLVVLVLFARTRHVRSLSLVIGILLLAVLIASDKLFLALSFGGAVLTLIAYAAIRAWSFVQFALRWIAGTAVAAVLSAAILTLITALHITHLISGGAASPYDIASGAHGVVLGAVYGALGFLTNMGANPAYDNLILRQLPGDFAHRLWSLSGLSYGVAAVVVVYALLLAWRVVWREPHQQRRLKAPVASLLAIGLIWSTVTAFGVFVLTNHDYVVDARYLDIGFFALVVTTAVALRNRRAYRPESVLGVVCCLLAAIVIAIGTSVHISERETVALNTITARNQAVAATLRQHKVDLLVGNYWRVLPIKLAMQGQLNVMPLSGCTEPTNVLTSSTWQPDLQHTNFAYLLTLGQTVADFPNCSVQQIVNAYGHPNATQLVSGTLAKPTEVMLFYDRGSNPETPKRATATNASSSILPITPSQLTDTYCAGATIMNVVAHEDDDLLFMNPDLIHDIQAGDCVRTVFLTAGNDGQGKPYWIGRQLGAEAAYSEMLGSKSAWTQKTVELANHEYVTAASPEGSPSVSLVFMNLPDGNFFGQGFPLSRFESLAKLRRGDISSIQTVDGQSSYTSAQLTAALVRLMQLYYPAEIHTQADVVNTPYQDHSDHITTGKYVQSAALLYDQKASIGGVGVPVKLYAGYPIHGYPANVAGADLTEKEDAFFTYAQHDPDVCRSVVDCRDTAYTFYLSGEYQAQS